MLRRLNHEEKLEALRILFKNVRSNLDPDTASENVLECLPHSRGNVSQSNDCILFLLYFFSLQLI